MSCAIPPQCSFCRAVLTEQSLLSGWAMKSVETTQVYIHADIELKERAMALTKPVNSSGGRYRPGDELLAFLEAL